ncbi:MAG: Acylphosphatase [candidate division BRC1 bacterium ADurb.BinA364]|nr:MAG: Acylphosphatase [candidate division BRC1 bacterium ADurb.BinA364]
MPCLHCIVEGRVQGVGFRYFAENQALALGLSGWVRNLRDGSVETEAEGPREALEQYLAALRRGPAFARVSALRETWSEAEGRLQGFRVERTL